MPSPYLRIESNGKRFELNGDDPIYLCLNLTKTTACQIPLEILQDAIQNYLNEKCKEKIFATSF